MNETNPSLPERAQSNADAAAQTVSGFQRAADTMRMLLQVGEKLLPPPYGHLASTASTLLKPKPPAPPTPAPPVNLAPLEEGLAELQARQSELQGHVTVQNAALQRIEQQLELVSLAVDGQAQTQQELMAEMKAVGRRLEEQRVASRKAQRMALAALGLLAVTLALNVILLLQSRHILP